MQEIENINVQDLGMSMIDTGRYEHGTRVIDVSTTISQSEYIEGEDIGEAEVYNDDGVCNQDIFENMQLEEVTEKDNMNTSDMNGGSGKKGNEEEVNGSQELTEQEIEEFIRKE